MATHFLTGFPGFIGKRLVAALLARHEETRVIALVEERMRPAAEQAAAAIGGGERIEILAGDITDRRLALSDADYERLTGEITTVHHLAAIYDLAVPQEIAQKVNVEGTGNVLDLCRRAGGLERLNYVSTAYVSGVRTGVAYEHELNMGQRFKNHYESTKFQAEVWVRELMDRVPTTIYRPAIVVGDSLTGETQKFDGPYYLLRFLSATMERGMPLANIGRGRTPFNVVPVDFIVDAMMALAELPEAVDETVHLCDPNPLSSHDVIEVLSDIYAERRPAYTLPSRGVSVALRIKKVREFYGGTPAQSVRYMNHPIRYDTRRADELLAAQGLRCPGFREYAPAMVAFFREHEEDPAFASAQ
jgi:thioester reductase-like protein